MRKINSLTVKYQGQTVGMLAETRDGKCAFQYDKVWQTQGFSLNPFSLPLTDKVFLPQKEVFEGLFGVFADSLPDRWGRLLVDRVLLSRKMSPMSVNAMTRLGIVGASGMGALEYYPELMKLDGEEKRDFDQLSLECERILKEENCQELDTLFRLGGSSGGARPKVFTTIDNEPWIVKFPASDDSRTIGEEEYQYMKCAEHCGILVPEVKLIPSTICGGYYGVKRFDRVGNRKIHMVTVSGLLETSHRIPNLDYHDLMRLTYLLTRDNVQMEEMYRRL